MISQPPREGSARGAPAGATGRVGGLTDDDLCVIRERHFGWERATPGLLADVFGVSVQRINAILRTAAA